MRFLAKILIVLAVLASTLPAAAGEVFVDAAGRRVTLPERVTRVLAAGPPASILLYTLAPETMVGWVRAPNAREKVYLRPEYRDLPETGRLTGRGNSASMESVLAARPDLIVDVGTIDATYVSLADRVQEQTRIPVVLLDGTFLKTAETYRLLGRILGKTGRAETLAAYAEATISGLKPRFDAVPPEKRMRIYYGRGADGLETGLAGSINVELIGIVGAVNVAEAAGRGGLASVSAEQVLAWNPGLILAASADFQRLALADPIWANLPAVQARRVFRTPSLPFGWFDTPPGVNRLIGIRWLGKLLYPESFPEDLTATVKDFYRLFYGVDLADADVAALVAGAVP